MTIQNSLKTLHISSAFAVLSLVIGVTLFGLVGGAQTFASNEYKPSTLLQNIFGANKQKERDPNQKLAADNANGLAELNNCNLRIKYPKQYLGSDVTVNRLQYSEDKDLQEVMKNIVEKNKQDTEFVNSFTKDMNQQLDKWQNLKNKGLKDINTTIGINYGSIGDQNSMFYTRCFETGNADLKEIRRYLEVIGNSPESYTTITTKELQEITGWFLTDKDLGQIYLESGFVPDSGIVTRKVTFQYKNLTYSIDAVSSITNIKPGSITGDEASRQFELLQKAEDPFNLKNKFGHDIQVQFID